MNPYEHTYVEDTRPNNRRVKRWAIVILATFVGISIGSFIFGPDVREHATPAPYVVAFAFSSLVCFVVSLLLAPVIA